jgi:MFS family permease
MIVQSMTGAITILYALELGADILQINLITTIQSTMGIFLLVPFGVLSDRFGRKPMILYSRAVMFFGILLQALAQTPHHLILASCLGGFAGGGFWPILLSMVGDVAKPEEQREAVSTFYLFSSVGLLTGPVICSFLLTSPQIALRNIYHLGVFGQLAILIYFVLQIQETKPSTIKKATYHRRSITEVLDNTGFRWLLAIAFFYFFSRSIVQTYIPIHARVELNLSNAAVASFSIYRNLAIMLIRFSSATFLKRLPIRSFLVSVIVIGGLTTFAAPLANSYFVIVFLLFLSGLSYGATAILGNTLVIYHSTAQHRGIANSLYNLSQSVGNVMKIVTSPIAEIFGLAVVFAIGGICGLIAALPPLLRKVEPSPSSTQDAR